MSNKAECPACKSYSSNIYSAITFSQSDCPYCGCAYHLIFNWNEMLPALEEAKKNKAIKDITESNMSLQQENARLKTKIHNMYNILAFRDIEELLEPFLEVKKILEEGEE